MKPKGTIKVKGWIVLNCKHPTSIIEWSADCGCSAQFYDCPPVFTKKKDAEEYLSSYPDEEKVVKCEISYSLPKTKKKIKR